MSKSANEAFVKLLKPLAETAEVEYRADESLLALTPDNDLATRLPNLHELVTLITEQLKTQSVDSIVQLFLYVDRDARMHESSKQAKALTQSESALKALIAHIDECGKSDTTVDVASIGVSHFAICVYGNVLVYNTEQPARVHVLPNEHDITCCCDPSTQFETEIGANATDVLQRLAKLKRYDGIAVSTAKPEIAKDDDSTVVPVGGGFVRDDKDKVKGAVFNRTDKLSMKAVAYEVDGAPSQMVDLYGFRYPQTKDNLIVCGQTACCDALCAQETVYVCYGGEPTFTFVRNKASEDEDKPPELLIVKQIMIHGFLYGDKKVYSPVPSMLLLTLLGVTVNELAISCQEAMNTSTVASIVDSKLQDLGEDAEEKDKAAVLETVANNYDSLVLLGFQRSVPPSAGKVLQAHKKPVWNHCTQSLKCVFARKGHLVAAQGITQDGIQMLFGCVYTSNNGGELLTVDDSIPLALFDNGVNTVALQCIVEGFEMAANYSEGKNKCTIAAGVDPVLLLAERKKAFELSIQKFASLNYPSVVASSMLATQRIFYCVVRALHECQGPVLTTTLLQWIGGTAAGLLSDSHKTTHALDALKRRMTCNLFYEQTGSRITSAGQLDAMMKLIEKSSVAADDSSKAKDTRTHEETQADDKWAEEALTKLTEKGIEFGKF